MKNIKFLSVVDEDKCIGCGLCETICPAGAISIQAKKAAVDDDLCRACSKCEDICPKEAVGMVERSDPFTVTADADAVNGEAVDALCARANLFPEQIICPCTMTPVKEIAAAILQGAKTPEDISVMTGVRTGCGVYCMGAVQRLLNASGVAWTPPDNNRWYKQCISMWNIPDDIVKRNPGYFIEEDRKLYTSKTKGGDRDDK